MGTYFTNGKTLNEKKQMANESIGSKVKIIRKSLKLNQQSFASEYDIKGGCSVISKIEHGKRSVSADVLPILAEDGNTTVEQFFRNDVSVTKNVFYDCLTNMDIDSNQINPMMSYIGQTTDEAMSNIGAVKLFDLLFTVIRLSAIKGDVSKIMVDELTMINLDEYENVKSRYINLLKEQSNQYSSDNE